MIPYLQKAQAGEPYDKGEFEACLTELVIEAVRLQAEAGIDVVSDGEYGKSGTWAFYVHRRLKGIEWSAFSEAELKDPMIAVISGRDREAFPEFYAEYDARVLAVARSAGRPIVTAPLVYTGQAELQRDIANLKAGLARTKGVTGFLPVVAPASALPNARNEYYRDEESFLFALAEALRAEYRAIIDAGLDLQVDDAFIPFMYEKMVPPMTLAQYRQWAALRIAALNHALEGLPPDRTRYHICWGSWNGPHMFDVPLKDIVDLVLEVKTGALSFEGKSAARARMADMEGGAAAAGQGADARSDRAFNQLVEHPNSWPSGSCALPSASSRQPDGRHRLRLLAEPACRPRPPQHHVGEAADAD